MMASLTLKWGTLKAWDFDGCPKALSAFDKYFELGMSEGAMSQQDASEQKALICEMIDAVADMDGEIFNDWEGTTMTKDEARHYVMNFGKRRLDDE